MMSPGKALGLDPVCGLKCPVFPTAWNSVSTASRRRRLEKQLRKSLGVTGDKPSWACVRELVGSADRKVKRGRCGCDLIQATGTQEAFCWKKGENRPQGWKGGASSLPEKLPWPWKTQMPWVVCRLASLVASPATGEVCTAPVCHTTCLLPSLSVPSPAPFLAGTCCMAHLGLWTRNQSVKDFLSAIHLLPLLRQV